MKYVIYIFALIGLLVVASSAYTFYVVSTSDRFTVNSDGFEISGDGSFSYSSDRANTFFSENIYFDYDAQYPYTDMPTPPIGESEMYGEIIKDGMPVAGITLEVILNTEYKTEPLTTDEEGIFSFSIESGDWTVNMIVIDGWQNKPEGDYLVVSGKEGSLASSKFSRYDSNGDNDFTLTKGDSIRIANLEINERLSISSPIDRPELSGTDNFDISWKPIPKASTYRVSISSVEAYGDGSSTSTVVGEKTTSELSIALSEWKTISDQENTNLYSVEIKAYDQEGEFVSESKQWSEGKFDLKGTKILAESVVSVLGLGLPDSDYDEYFKNQKRISTVDLLIEEGLLDEAEKVINLITENAEKGKKNALTGYLYAMRNDCESANSFFDKAIEEGGVSCILTSYRNECSGI